MPGLRIAHLINPVKVDESRDLHFQQPITFETMRIARDFFHQNTNDRVYFYAVVYEEDAGFVPDDFDVLPYLERSTLDAGFKIPRKLPYFKDMLDKLYYGTDENFDYVIQTNADIGLTPHFYMLVASLIKDGNDAFCINKRILPEELKDQPLPVIWSYIGGGHAGHDCFVFRRELTPALKIGKICMGTPWSETTMITSLVAYAKNFKVFKNANATFHLGDRRIWLPHDYNDYRIHNTNEFARVLKALSKKKNILKHETIQYLLGKLKQEVYGYKNEVYSKDCHDLIK